MTRKPGKVIRRADPERPRRVPDQAQPALALRRHRTVEAGGDGKAGREHRLLEPGRSRSPSTLTWSRRVDVHALRPRNGGHGGRERRGGPGDFVWLSRAGVAHLVRNPFEAECCYLMGGRSATARLHRLSAAGEAVHPQARAGEADAFTRWAARNIPSVPPLIVSAAASRRRRRSRRSRSDW